MDLIILSVLFTIVAFFLSIFIVTGEKYQSSIKLPHGRRGWPIIGESRKYLNAGRRGVPREFIQDRMQKFSSQIFRTSLFGETVAVMCGPAGNKFLFSNENTVVTLWWPASFSRIFFSSARLSNNEESLRTRKLMAEFLRTEPLHKYVGIMDAIAHAHLKENFDGQKKVIVFPLVKSYAFKVACKLLMSIDNPIQLAKFVNPLASVVSGMVSLPINLHGTPYNKAVKASTRIRKDLLEIIRQRKIDVAEGNGSPSQDMLSHMLVTGAESGHFIEEYDIADKILGLMVAGDDTISSAITFVVKYLAELPHIYDEVHKEQVEILSTKASGDPLNWGDIQKMRYSWNVACEVMRLVPPFQGAFRVALTDFTFNGFYVPKGWKLLWNAYSTHMNPTYFQEPDKFDPSRFEGNGPAPYTFVAFGGGPRMCPGNEYARLVILVFMHNLVTKFKWEKILPGENIVVDPFPIPDKGLPVRLEPHVY